MTVETEPPQDPEAAGPEAAEPEAAGPEPAEPEEAEVPRRGRTAFVVSVVIAVLVAGFVVVLATGDPATDRETSSPLIGELAPPLAGETLDGGDFDVGDHRGSWVVVNFFATWCLPCVQEHPELRRFDEEHRQEGDATLVSVLFENDLDTARRFFEENGGGWPVVVDGRGLIATDYVVPKVPETYIVDPDGVVVAKLIGGVTQAKLEQVMQEGQA